MLPFFKKMVHMTPWEYLLEYRLSRSMELLEKKDLNISEIAEMTGFCTVSYYITAFKRKTGDTPLEYRKKEAYLHYRKTRCRVRSKQ
ncbi:helix-turn-helix transcriptional regulator [Blautia sp. RD014234]|nr:helix-turn-helix transcriptional regulator [Blautia parvula]